MRRVLVLGILVVATAFALAADSGDAIPADGGPIQVTPVMRTSVQIEYGGKIIQVNPVGKYDNVEIPFVGKFDALKPADLILISDIHPNELDLDTEEIAKIRKPGAPVVMSMAVAALAGAKIPPPTTIMANGEMMTVAGISIEATPMFNLLHGPKAGEVYHPKGRGNGYVLTLGYEGQRRDETLFRAFLKSTPVDVRINTKG